MVSKMEISVFTLSCRRIVLHVLMCLIYWPTAVSNGSSLPKQDVVMQIIVPLQSLEPKLQPIHVYEKTSINMGFDPAFRKLRDKFVIDSWLNSTQSETPAEILTLFCSEVFVRHVNAILSFNYGSGSVAANDYIMQLADTLGYPVISWDPQYPGALQSEEDSRVLQIAPTIYHQCQALVRLLDRYNWTDFSIVTTKVSSGGDFISCMRSMVDKTSITQGFIKKAKFKLLSIVRAGDTSNRREMRHSLQSLVRTVSRVLLLHADQHEAYDILEAAAEENLTGPKYMWLLTSSSVGSVSTFSHKSIPVGTLGLMYNDSVEAIKEALKFSVKIWALGLNAVAGRDDLQFRRMMAYPINSCNSSLAGQYWKDGSHLYSEMKKVRLDSPLVSFTENGVIEQVELNILNIRPVGYDRRFRRVVNKWEEVGRVFPKKTKDGAEMSIELDEIVWPGGAVVPPKGKPDKRFFRIVTLKEDPYIMYVPPDPLTETCGIHSVPCKLVTRPIGYYGNLTYDKKGMIDFCCTGLCVDLLKKMADRMEFNYEMYEVGDQKWGIQNNVTGEWNGLIKEMVDRKADMVLTSIKINHQRAAAIDFSTPFLETGITIMVSIRKGAISATAFLEPFDMVAWLLILILCIHVVALILLIFEWASPIGMNRGKPLARGETEPYDYPSWCLILVFSVHATGAAIFIFEWLSPSGLNKGQTPLREHKFSLFRSFWLIWAMLFGASVSTDNPRGMSSRFLGNVWALFALVFLASYTANLAAFMITIDEFYDLSGIDDWRIKSKFYNNSQLTISVSGSPKNRIEHVLICHGSATRYRSAMEMQLMHPTKVSPNFKFATVPDGSTEDNIKKNYPRMHRYMKKYDEPTVDDGIKALQAKKIHAFIYDATVLEYKVGKDPDCDLITVGKWYAMTGYGVGFPRGSSYIEEVNKILLELQHNGDLDRLQKFWLAGACHAVKDKKDKSSPDIGILNFTSAFILLAGGVLLGTMLLAFEHLYFKFGRKCLKKYDKSGCCALISLSMGKSLTFEQSVMDAIDFHKRHRCKDPLCETQLWRAKHELDLALIKLDKLKTELADMDKDSGHATIEATIVEEDEANQPNHVNNLIPNSNSHNSDTSHNITLPNNLLVNIDNCDNHKTSPKESKGPNIELNEIDKRRQQFRRSPSYTNAMSTDDEAKEPKSSDTDVCTHDASPRRCPSYSQAVEDGPVLDGKRTNDPKPHIRTRFYDGKYYVGVSNDNEESGL